MRITQKGQVTIPQDVRSRLGLLPYTEVEFEIAGDHARIRKAAGSAGAGTRGQNAIKALWGAADTSMSTDEIMALTRAVSKRGAVSRGTGRRAKR
jgi:AbrB family looped-hinge helix DNA binding protein